ncbi:hypothetical protein [Mesorhizobium sp. CAU 1741]|uniref:DUF968 domain-containing protein n=1 Tax=Mesorhizobium sp. CAU 1741 TaxID=3140366 RepID=UPI00325C1F31
MGFRIARPETAFSNAPIGKQKKRQRDHDAKHLDWIRTLPCVITGNRPVEAAHIRYADPVYGKSETGMGEKPSDKWTVPLTSAKHREQHSGNEKLFWLRHGLDPLRIALALYSCTGDDEQGHLIIREAIKTAASFAAAQPTGLYERGQLLPSGRNSDDG